MQKKQKKKKLKDLGFKNEKCPPYKGNPLRRMKDQLVIKLPKDAPSDEGIPTGDGSDFEVEKVPGGFEVF